MSGGPMAEGKPGATKLKIEPLASEHLERVCTALPARSSLIHRKRLDDQLRGELVYLVAWEGDTPVGHVLVVDGERGFDSEWRERLGCAQVEDLFVDVDHRGRGYGRALFAAAEVSALSRDHCLLGLATGTVADPGYAAARSLYDSMGYVDVARGPWIESWPTFDEEGRARPDGEILGSYLLKALSPRCS